MKNSNVEFTRITFIHKGMKPFVKMDIEILSEKNRVKVIYYKAGKGIGRNLVRQFLLFVNLLFSIRKIDLFYIWFVDYHAFVPALLSRVFRKKLYLVVGGYELTWLPEIQYGGLSNPIRRFCIKYALKHASLCLPVADGLAVEIKALIPKAAIKVIHTGYSSETFSAEEQDKQPVVLSVLSGNSKARLLLKGVDLLIQTARLLPDTIFYLVGTEPGILLNYFELPPNLIITGLLTQDKLLEYYRKARVLAHFSLREGLPNVICEAMLCRCFPVVFRTPGTELAVGDCGIYLEKREPDEAVRLIIKALVKDFRQTELCRQRIINEFPLNKRRSLLLKEVIR